MSAHSLKSLRERDEKLKAALEKYFSEPSANAKERAYQRAHYHKKKNAS